MTRWEAETLLYRHEMVETAESDRLSSAEREGQTGIGHETCHARAMDDNEPKDDE